jgi:hypothetical protein
MKLGKTKTGEIPHVGNARFVESLPQIKQSGSGIMARTKRNVKHMTHHGCESCSKYILDCARGLKAGMSPVYVRGWKEHAEGQTRRFWKSRAHRIDRRNSQIEIEFELKYF